MYSTLLIISSRMSFYGLLVNVIDLWAFLKRKSVLRCSEKCPDHESFLLFNGAALSVLVLGWFTVDYADECVVCVLSRWWMHTVGLWTGAEVFCSLRLPHCLSTSLHTASPQHEDSPRRNSPVHRCVTQWVSL